jgi:hypothetical protein
MEPMHRTRISLQACLLALTLPFSVAAALPPGFQTAVLPAVGLKLPLPADALSQPIPPVEVHTYVLQRGSESWTEDRYRALELWYATQHVAEWALPGRGSRLLLGTVTLAPPVGFTDTDITRDQFSLYTNSPQASVEAADSRLLRLWLAAFSGCTLGDPQPLPVGRTRLSHLYRYPTDRSDIHAWLFRFNRSGGLSHLPDVWIALVSVLDTAKDGAAEAAFVEQTLLANLAPMGRFEGRETTPARLLRERAQKGVRQHPSRAAAHASIAAHPDWWALDSEDYVLLSNGREDRKTAQALLEDLQQARAFYAAAFPGFPETAEDVSVIRLVATEQEYEGYVTSNVGEDLVWTAGLYDGGKRELVIRPIPAKTRNAAYKRTFQTALHEGFHQYLHQATGIARPAVWFNEGYAAFFEGLSFRNGKPVFDEDEGRFQVLSAFLAVKPAQPIPLRTLLSLDYEGYYAGTDADRSFKYALGWAFIYFLERGAPLVRNKPYAAILPSYYAALRETGDGAAATVAAFQGVNMAALERDFRAFWTNPRDRSLAKRR